MVGTDVLPIYVYILRRETSFLNNIFCLCLRKSGINYIIMQVPKIISEGISALNNDIKKHIYTLIYSTLSLS